MFKNIFFLFLVTIFVTNHTAELEFQDQNKVFYINFETPEKAHDFIEKTIEIEGFPGINPSEFWQNFLSENGDYIICFENPGKYKIEEIRNIINEVIQKFNLNCRPKSINLNYI